MQNTLFIEATLRENTENYLACWNRRKGSKACWARIRTYISLYFSLKNY